MIASSDDGAVTVDELEAGDVARSYNADGTPAGNATYDGTPVISGACVGGTTFTATRAATAEVEYAGAFTGSALEPLTASWDAARPAHVTLTRPLGDEDMVFVSVARHDVDPPVTSMRIEPAVTCSANPNPGATPNPAAARQKPTPRQPNGAKLSLRPPARRWPRRSCARGSPLPVTLPERGRIDLRLILKGKHDRLAVARTAKRRDQGHAEADQQRLKRGAKVTLRGDVHALARRGQAPAREREGDPYGFVVESVNVSVLAYVPVRSGSFAPIDCLKSIVTASLETGAGVASSTVERRAARARRPACSGCGQRERAVDQAARSVRARVRRRSASRHRRSRSPWRVVDAV